MSKKAPPPAPPPGSFWLPFAAIGLVGGLVGATITYLALRPQLQPPAMAPVAAPNPDPSTHLPAPELTAGQSPAQAARTLGNFYYDHQNWPEAINQYEAAIRQGLDDPDIRTDLGNAYRFTGRFDDALAQYHRAQAQDPRHEFSLFNQGGVYLLELKQPAKAIAVWEEYLARFPAGQNVAAARQLIAQAQAGASQPSPAEAIILKHLPAGPAKPGQP